MNSAVLDIAEQHCCAQCSMSSAGKVSVQDWLGLHCDTIISELQLLDWYTMMTTINYQPIGPESELENFN